VGRRIDEAKAAAREVEQPHTEEADDELAPPDPTYEETEEGFSPS
jgi:hypothetical protein